MSRLAEETVAANEAATIDEFIKFLQESSARRPRAPGAPIGRFNQTRAAGCVPDGGGGAVVGAGVGAAEITGDVGAVVAVAGVLTTTCVVGPVVGCVVVTAGGSPGLRHSG